MSRRIAALVSAPLALASAAATAPPTTSAAGPPPPSLSAFVLAPEDFDTGGAVATQTTTSVGGRPAFLRVFKPGASLRGSRLAVAVTLALLEPDAQTAAADFAQLNGAMQSRSGRTALAKEWALDFLRGAEKGGAKGKLHVKKSVVGTPVEAGPAAVRLPLTLHTNEGAWRISIGFTQADRVLAVAELFGAIGRPVGKAAQSASLAALQRHLQAGFTIADVAPPTVAGNAEQGQTLTADPGSWTGSPTSFGYAWSRCDPTGAGCRPIEGATAATYTVGPADAGSTLRVAVTGANTVSTLEAVSVPTPAVT